MRRVAWLVSMVIWLAVSAAAFAQDEEEAAPSPEDAAAAAEPEPEPEPGAKPEPAGAAPAEKTLKWFVGPYIEGIIVPSFMTELFLDASPTVFNPSYGVTVTHRNPDGPSWVLGLGYASYHFDGPFRAKGDPEEDTEWLDSTLGFLHVRGLLMWTAQISQMFAFEYGVGIEFGVVLGRLKRTEAYRDANGEFHPCDAVGMPPNVSSGGIPYCEPTAGGGPTDAFDAKGAHYGVTEERVPPIAAAVMLPQLALRFAPAPQWAIKVEAAYGIMQFTFGLSAAYAIDS